MNIVDLFVKYILAAACAFVAMHASDFVRIDNAIGFAVLSGTISMAIHLMLNYWLERRTHGEMKRGERESGSGDHCFKKFIGNVFPDAAIVAVAAMLAAFVYKAGKTESIYAAASIAGFGYVCFVVFISFMVSRRSQ